MYIMKLAFNPFTPTHFTIPHKNRFIKLPTLYTSYRNHI